MAARLQATAAGDKGTVYDVYIMDSSYAGAATSVSLGGDGFELTYTPNREEPDAEILASSVKVVIESTSATEGDIESLISDLESADEERFAVWIDNNADSSLFWYGYIVTDQISYEDNDYADGAFAFTITAVDGIARLKAVDYDDSAALAVTDYRELWKTHFFNILGHIGVTSIYGGTDVCLSAVCRWYEEDMDLDLTINPLDRTYIDHSAFITSYNDDEAEFLSAYDVLLELLKLFQLRFLYSDGKYWLIQINEYRNQGSLYIHNYYKDGTKPGTDVNGDLTIIEDSDDGIRLANGVYSTFAPARRIQVTFKNIDDANLLAGKIFDDGNTTQKYVGQYYDFADSWFVIKGAIQASATLTNGGLGCAFVFDINIRVVVDGMTSYYLNRDYTLSGSQYTYGNVTWETATNSRYSIITNPVTSGNVTTKEVSIVTPDLPGSGEYIDVYVELDYNTSLYSTSTSQQWIWLSPFLRIISDDPSSRANESIHYIDNGDAPNSSLEIEREHLLGDAYTAVGSRQITIQDSLGNQIGAGDWINGITPGTDYLIQTLYIKQLMILRGAPLKKWEGTIYSADLKAHNVFQFSTTNEKYAFIRAVYNAAREEWRGLTFYTGYGDPVAEEAEVVKFLPPVEDEGGIIGDIPSIPPASAEVGALGGFSGDTVGTLSSDLLSGATTSLSINALGVDGIINSGDTIYTYNPVTGLSEEFTVSADVSAADTTISVNSTTVTNEMIDGSYVIAKTETLYTNIQNSSGAFATASNVTSNSPGTIATDDFVFGSDQLDDAADANKDKRFLFDKSAGAFYAGEATATEWDTRGINSINLGVDNTTTSASSAAIGDSNTVGSSYSLLVGRLNTDSSSSVGSRMYAFGQENEVAESYTMAIGNEGRAELYGSLAHSAGEFSSVGDAQALEFIMRGEGTGTGAISLYLDGSAKVPDMPEYTYWNAWVDFTAVIEDVGNGTGISTGDHDFSKYHVAYSRASGACTKYISQLIGTRTAATNIGGATIFFGGSGINNGPRLTYTPDATYWGSTTVTRIIAVWRIAQIKRTP